MIERESRGCERSFLNTYYSWFTERRYIDFIQQIQYYTGYSGARSAEDVTL